MTRCKYYREEYVTKFVTDEKGVSRRTAVLEPFCHATQPHERCYCKGDKNDCDFTPEELSRGKKK